MLAHRRHFVDPHSTYKKSHPFTTIKRRYIEIIDLKPAFNTNILEF
jgi:hypothetical protein